MIVVFNFVLKANLGIPLQNELKTTQAYEFSRGVISDEKQVQAFLVVTYVCVNNKTLYRFVDGITNWRWSAPWHGSAIDRLVNGLLACWFAHP